MNKVNPESAGPTNSRQRVEACLAQIGALNSTHSAMITPLASEAAAAAEQCDAATARGEWLGPLHGVVVSLKDNIDTAGIQTTYGSDFFRGHIPSVDAEVVRLLKAAGAIIIGKDNLHEFALGLTSQNPHYGACRNPWDPTRVPGGSSGGSAVAILTGMTEVSLGTDSGGSGRVPAAANGISALRPTLGSISSSGVSTASPLLATVSPLARRVSDIARLFAVLNVPDAQDATSNKAVRRDVLTGLRDGIAGVRIGRPDEFFFAGLPEDIASRVDEAIETLAALGATIVPLSLPDAADAQRQQSVLLQCDGAARHRQRVVEEPQRFGANVLNRLRLGMEVSGMDYSTALRWRREWVQSTRAAFEQVDLIATPTLPISPPLAEEPGAPTNSPEVGRFVAPWSMAGVPALTVPCGMDTGGLPVGLQLAAGPNNEALLLRAGAAYQDVTDWHLAQPA